MRLGSKKTFGTLSRLARPGIPEAGLSASGPGPRLCAGRRKA